MIALSWGCWLLLAALSPTRALAQDPAAPPPANDLKAEVDALREEVRRLHDRLDGKPEAGKADVAEVATSAFSIHMGEGKPGKDGGGGLVIEVPGKLRLRFDAQLRWRAEYRGDRYAQPKTNSETDFVGQRIRLGCDIDVGEHLGARIVIQDTRLWGDKADAFVGARLDSDQPELMLREGYGVLREPFGIPLELKVGRMSVPNLGNQRLISNLDWSFVGRAWDGVQLTFEPKGWWMTGFASNIREASALPVPGDENDDVWFLGAYVSNRMVEKHELDAFLYWRHIGDDRLGALTTNRNGATGKRKDYTAGLRLKGELGLLFYNGLIAYQFGDQVGDTIDAWATAVEAGVKVDLGGGQRLSISSELAWSSGDGKSTDKRIRTFDPLLPFAHFFNGHQDLFAWRNLYSTNLKLAYAPLENLSLHTDLHGFWLDRRDDLWYGIGFTRADTANRARSSYAGLEVDTYAKLTVVGGRLSFWGGYSHFFPGSWVRTTGSKTSGQDWVFLMTTLDF
ncbi:MAG: alginate export family protein [Planctomycetota bacterium]